MKKKKFQLCIYGQHVSTQLLQPCARLSQPQQICIIYGIIYIQSFFFLISFFLFFTRLSVFLSQIFFLSFLIITNLKQYGTQSNKLRERLYYAKLPGENNPLYFRSSLFQQRLSNTHLYCFLLHHLQCQPNSFEFSLFLSFCLFPPLKCTDPLNNDFLFHHVPYCVFVQNAPCSR